jgi:circadian clock protein KaiC
MKTYNEIRQIIEDSQYDRMVIDSLTSFALSPAPISSIDGAISVQQRAVLNEIIRTNVVSIYDIAKKHGVTTVSISQKVEGMPGDTVDNVSEFIGDGLVLMNFTEMGKSLNRTIQVKKMRKTKINGVSHSFDFTNEGIVVKS